MPRSRSTLAPVKAVVVRRFIASVPLPLIFLADQRRSVSTTSTAWFGFRLGHNLGRGTQGLGRVCIEKRSQIGVPPAELGDVQGTNSHLLEEGNDLFFPLYDPLLDERQALFAIDCVERLEDQTVAPLPTLSWNERDQDVVIARLIGHPPQKGQAQERHVTGNDQAVVVRRRRDRGLNTAECTDVGT